MTRSALQALLVCQSLESPCRVTSGLQQGKEAWDRRVGCVCVCAAGLALRLLGSKPGRQPLLLPARGFTGIKPSPCSQLPLAQERATRTSPSLPPFADHRYWPCLSSGEGGRGLFTTAPLLISPQHSQPQVDMACGTLYNPATPTPPCCAHTGKRKVSGLGAARVLRLSERPRPLQSPSPAFGHPGRHLLLAASKHSHHQQPRLSSQSSAAGPETCRQHAMWFWVGW